MAEKGSGMRAERIGEFLVKIGAMMPWQVDAVLRAQADGDRRMFGEIAIARGYIDDVALRRYVDVHALLAAGPRHRDCDLPFSRKPARLDWDSPIAATTNLRSFPPGSEDPSTAARLKSSRTAF
jgi:hypothetical protein